MASRQGLRQPLLDRPLCNIALHYIFEFLKYLASRSEKERVVISGSVAVCFLAVDLRLLE